MNIASQKINIDKLVAKVLPLLAKQDVLTHKLASIEGSNIYQLQYGWSRSVLLDQQQYTKTMNTGEFEAAVQNPDVETILVPANANLTFEIAQRVLKRNSLSKTILWEANNE